MQVARLDVVAHVLTTHRAFVDADVGGIGFRKHPDLPMIVAATGMPVLRTNSASRSCNENGAARRRRESRDASRPRSAPPLPRASVSASASLTSAGSGRAFPSMISASTMSRGNLDVDRAACAQWRRAARGRSRGTPSADRPARRGGDGELFEHLELRVEVAHLVMQQRCSASAHSFPARR